MSESTETKDQNWLQRLKEESWEAELLISTVAIFGTLQLFKLIDWVTILALDLLPPWQYYVGYLIVLVGLSAVSIWTSMFVAHFLLRAYWVGLVGLNSVFPDYGLEDSAYSEIYTKKMSDFLPKLKKTIHDVDELSSVIFSAAFVMLLIYSNASILICLGLILFNLLYPYLPMTVLIIPLVIYGIAYVFIVIIGVVANIKKFKQNERIQNWYFKSVKWSNYLLSGPLYKYTLQIQMTFGSNYKKKKSLVWLTISIVVIGFIITMVQFKNSSIPYLVSQKRLFDTTRAYTGFYTNRNEEGTFLLTPQIDQDIVETDLVRLFIPIFNYELNIITELYGPVPEGGEEQEDRKKKSKWYLDTYSIYHEVILNGQKINPDFLKFEQPKTGQFGVIAYLDLINAKRGTNRIKVVKKMEEPMEWEIPFQWLGR